MKPAMIPWSYHPVRKNLPLILNVPVGMYSDEPGQPWHQIEPQIIKSCANYADDERRRQQRYYNIEKGRSLYDFCLDKKLSFIKHDIKAKLHISQNQSLVFWHNYLGKDENGLFLNFFDFRTNNGLEDEESRQFFFSIQKWLVIDQSVDMDGIRPSITRVDGSKKKGFKTVHYLSNGQGLYTPAEIAALVEEVLEDWYRVEREIFGPERLTGTGN